ncbi:hypothetical protein C5F61_01205 [Photobacterium damselae subsp. damselae]|uniref:hypothetical protein n=1 Tax=Photobacterium damselae TaxID=38293 RepID=UPI000D053483|nr:hypothetical protein [Photobacterium damselae]PSB81799.1 hypothetical protein C5F61_01205 [Photobacterium damselae subsp. damselae]
MNINNVTLNGIPLDEKKDVVITGQETLLDKDSQKTIAQAIKELSDEIQVIINGGGSGGSGGNSETIKLELVSSNIQLFDYDTGKQLSSSNSKWFALGGCCVERYGNLCCLSLAVGFKGSEADLVKEQWGIFDKLVIRANDIPDPLMLITGYGQSAFAPLWVDLVNGNGKIQAGTAALVRVNEFGGMPNDYSLELRFDVSPVVNAPDTSGILNNLFMQFWYFSDEKTKSKSHE